MDHQRHDANLEIFLRSFSQIYPSVKFLLSTVNDKLTKKSSVYLISPAIKSIMDPYMLVKLSKWTLFFIVFFFVLNIMFPQFWMIYVRCTIFILYHTSRKLFSFLKAMYLDKNDHLKVNMDAMKNLPFLLNFWTIRAFYPKLNLKYLQTVRNNDLLMHSTFEILFKWRITLENTEKSLLIIFQANIIIYYSLYQHKS